MDDIQMAQVEAGESAVVERLRQKGLMPPEGFVEERATLADRERTRERAHLEHLLASGFVSLQRERNPARRQELWLELQRLAGEIERLSE